MPINPDLIRFFHKLMKKDSAEYRSLHAYIERLLVQLELDQTFRTIDVFKALYYRIRNTERSDSTIQSQYAYIRRSCLHLLQDLKQIHDDEPLADFPIDKSPGGLHKAWPSIDVEKGLTAIYLALASMSERDRNVLYLRHFRGLSWIEISQVSAHNSERVSTMELSDIAQEGEDALQNLRLMYMSIYEEPEQ